MLRVIVGTSVVLSSGCAYFHPAFMTDRGVLVCHRDSLRRSACSVVARSELDQVLTEQTYRDLLR
jgi:hypothetical protein